MTDNPQFKLATKWNQQRYNLRHPVWFISERLYRWIGDGHFLTGPPLNEAVLKIPMDDSDTYYIAFQNDAFEIWFGTAHKWDNFYRREVFNKIVRWYLWQVIVVG